MFQYRVRIPPSTDTTIVFPYDPRSKAFYSGHCSPERTDGRATSEQIQQVLFEIELVLQFYQQKTTSASWGILRFLLVFLLAYLIMLIFFGGIATSTLWLVAGIFLGLAIISGLGYSCYNQSNYNEGRRLVQDILNRFNPDFNARGLSWRLPADSMHWVELSKDYMIGEVDQQNMRFGVYVDERKGEEYDQLLTKARGEGNEGYAPPGQYL